MKSRITALLLFTLTLLGFAAAASANTPPILRITTNAGQVATIDSTGAVLFSGTCAANCSSSFVSVATPGQVVWAGQVGTFTITLSVGLTKPIAFPSPSQDLNLQRITTTADGTITFEWTDTNFSTPGITSASVQAGGVLTGNGSSTYRAYFDDTNAPFGTGILVGTLGPLGTGAFATIVTGPGPSQTPFSMTEVATINLTAGSRIGVDFQFIAQPSPLKLTCPSSTGEVGAAYSSSLIASGGVPPYTYSITGGNLPPGLSLNPTTGAITGIPTQGGTFSFTAQVVDSSGSATNTTTSSCAIVVTAPAPLSVFCPTSTGQVGVAFNSAISASGGLPPYTYSISAGALPDGLTLNPTTGAITGIPTNAGTFNFTAQVVDSRGNASGTATSNCSIVIAPAPPTLLCAGSTGQVGVAYNSALVANGGAPPYTFSITAGSLPPGLSLNTVTGAIIGTPTTAGAFNFTAQVVDSRGNASGTATSNCSITIAPAVSATCVAIVAVQGVAITPVTMVGSGGAGAPYTFSATGLPTGLTMSTGGTISGTPTVSGTFNYTVTVTDKDGNTGSVNCSVTVNPRPSATCIVITAIQGVAITPVTMVGSGSAGAPYTFSATGLPTGLTMSTGGTISGTPTVSGTFNYTVTVTDKDGNTGSVNCSVTVNPLVSTTCIAITTIQGVAITPVTMVGSGGAGAPYTFSATGLPTGLTMSTGGTISGTPTVSGTFNYTVTVTDKDGNTGTVNCSVTVNPPVSATCIAITAIQGVAITPVTMTATGGAGAPYTFSATGLPTGLTVSTGGTISGTPTVSGTFNYTVTVTDKDGNTGTVNCSVTVNPPVSATCIAITAIQGVAITPVTMVGSGGAGAPYTFSATGLPTGLTMSTGGTISGTPTVSGTFNYTVTVTDKDGNIGTVNCSVTVNPPVSATCIAITAIQGVAITPVTMVGSGGAGAPYTFSATGLPTGLTMSTGGTISGTPTVTGAFNYTVTVTDKDGNTGTVNCSVTVNPRPTATCITIVAVQGVAITPVTMTATGGNGAPYTFSATGLPTGLTMSTGGTISGTPTVTGTFNYTVTVTDKDGNTGTVNCSVTVSPRPTATCITINAIQGVAITPVTMTATGGAGAPYTFSATGLPTGLTMSTGGTISGTPTVTGTFNYTVTVTDKNGNTGTVNCSVTVSPRPSATCVTITALQGVAITPVTMTATGGAGAPYTFSATGLPTGLTMSTGGTISGTPTVSGTFNYTVTVTDKNGNTGTVNCSVTVTPQVVCVPTTFDLTGNTGTTGAVNIRTFTAPNGVQVKVSGWSRDKGTGAWAAAYIGSYASGLGVTDTSENGSDPSHRVDNIGRVNYVLFEFSAPVIVNRAFLDAVGVDSDISVWIGTKTNPFANHITLSDAQLTSLSQFEENQTTSQDSRWADINGSNLAGNVLVIAALASDTSAEDEFKIAKLDTACITTPGPPTATCVSITAVQNVAIAPVSMSATGGAGGPYTFSATGLPTGLTMSSTGTISGTPTVSGTFTYTVTVKDKNGATGTVNCSVTVNPGAVCIPSTITLTGSTASSGTAGNIRTFTGSNGVQVKVSGWGRNKSTGAWAKAYLGAYSSGLGVTDDTEDGSDPSHRTDNIGSRINYVLFEFSTPVIVNRAFLDAVGVDSDVSVWVGNKTNPFVNHLTLSDSLLSSLGAVEENLTTLSSSRWADINGGNISGNVLVIAALASDTSAEDEFKISKLDLACPTTPGKPTASCVVINAVQGVALTPVTMTATGGAGAPYTFTATGLPAGLSMSTSGAISGTPTVTGTFSYTVTIKDKNGVTGTVNCSLTVNGGPVCIASTFDVTGNTATTGTAGNVRTFTAASGVKVKASGWSRTKSGGTWATAYLGAYSSGLGVTDTGESSGDPDHKVDNVGSRINYVLFEFSAPVIVNRAFLDSIGADSDVSVWIGTKTDPFNNHLALNDALLTSLGAVEENSTTSSSSRWADFNNSSKQGNVLVIAALASDTSAEDEFKISKIETVCLPGGGYKTFTATQGGWGSTPSGSNPGALLAAKFSTVYPGGSVVIGGTHKLTFTSASAIANFLPQGGTAGKLTSSSTNPTTSSAGVLAGQVLALNLNVDFSNKGITPTGLANLKVVSGPAAGLTVAQVLSSAESILGGGALPSGFTYSDVVDIVDDINNAFNGGTINTGFLK